MRAPANRGAIAAVAFGLVLVAGCGSTPHASATDGAPTAAPVPTTPQPAAAPVDSAHVRPPNLGTDEEPNGDVVPASPEGIAGWGTSLFCIGLSTDVRPPRCTDPTGCYKLELMDATISVVSLKAKKIARADVEKYYESAWPTSSSVNELKDCFAYEIERGRPPSGNVRVALDGQGDDCPREGAKIVSRDVGTKTAECVRDMLKRLRLPAANGKIKLEVEVAVSGF